MIFFNFSTIISKSILQIYNIAQLDYPWMDA